MPAQFTPEARMAAQRARRIRAEQHEAEFGVPTVVVVRAPDGLGYSWEIRKFGGWVLRTTPACFDTPEQARHAGRAALDAMADQSS